MKRKNKILPLIAGMVIALAVILGGGTALAEGEFAGGEGTQLNPYEIETAEQLNNVRNYLSSHFILANDINLSAYLSEGNDGWNEGKGWIPIGSSGTPFTGSFDGGESTITGLSINRPTEGGVALFGYTGADAQIRDLRLVVVEVTGKFYVGGLVGENQGEIENCSIEGNITGNDEVGGLVGWQDSGTVHNSYSQGNVTGCVIHDTPPEEIGGLVGNNVGSITYSYAMVTVNVDGYVNEEGREEYLHVGGLAGLNGGSITNSYATGEVAAPYATDDVTAGYAIGGLVGFNSSFGSGATITNSYATGKVTGEEYVGGLAGDNQGHITNSYATGEVTGENNIGGLVGLNQDEIVDSHSVSTVNGNNYVGGLVGSNCSTINSAYASGEVSGGGYYIGGLVGQNQNTIENSYATGQVIGVESVGGLVGQNEGSISNSYSISQVIGDEYVGGLVGYNDNGIITSSFWDTQTAGQDSSDGGAGKTTAEMQSYLTFFNAGWDFIGETGNGEENIWGIDETVADPANGGYPFLSWQGNDHKVRTAVATAAVDGITATGAVGHGEILIIGYPNPSQHGVVWSVEENPALDDNKTEEGKVSVAGEFDSTITGLDPETNYYVRSYATNDLGTVYGEQVQFTTSSPAAVDIAAISGITLPAAGGTPVTSITETDQYTGTVSWNPGHDPFKGETVYTATITLTAKTGFTFEGVTADFFTVAGAETVNNDAGSGVVTAVFPETGAVGVTYSVAITVKDSEGAAIEGAEIAINSETFTTDTDGVVTIELGDGTYPYSVTKAGFHAVSDGSITVDGAAVAEAVEMNPVSVITVTATSPENGTTGVTLTSSITVTFSENIEADTGYGDITLKDAGNNNINISTSISCSVLTITPETSLAYSTSYTVTIPTAAVKSEATEANMGQQYLFSFTTRSAPSGGGGGGSANLPPAGGTFEVTPDQIISLLSKNQALELNSDQLRISISPGALSSLQGGGNIEVQTLLTTDPATLNTFFIAYPGQKGIMKGYNISFTRENNGQTENITQLDGEITLTFQLSPEELEGIDPSTLIIYKQGDDGSITELSGEFDWATNSVSITTSHLCEFYIMGKEGIPTQRLAGDNRYATAVAISQEGWVTSDDVILASGENFPDALAGTTLAGIKDAPILLTGKDILNSDTLAEIFRLKARNIYILGGTSVISQHVEKLLAQEYNVTRISGTDRYETAVRIGRPIMDSTSAADTAVLATGSNYPDALSMAAFAGQYRLPVLFTEKDVLNPYARQALADWGIKKIILTGGSSVISQKVEDILRDDLQLNVTRLSGEDRYLTCLEIAKYFENYPEGISGTGYKKAALSTGENFPDALAGAALAVKEQYPVLLARKEGMNQQIKEYFNSLAPEKIYLYGGQNVIEDLVQ